MHPGLRTCCAALMLLAPGIVRAQTAQPAQPATATSTAAPHAERPRVRAAARTSAVTLDGVLDEAVWATAPKATNFTQQEPNEGQPATQQTEVQFAYDDDA